MTISVIIPIYKAEQYIRQSLRSVIEQEFEECKIECILVDDNTPDRSMEIAKEVIGDYKGSNISFVLLRHEVNKGVSAARNTGLSIASGDFIFFMDSDDVIAENTLKCLFSYYLEHPFVDIVMGCTLWLEDRFLSNSPVTGNVFFPYMIDDLSLMWRLVLRRQIDRQVVNKLMRRSIIVENNLFFDEHVAMYEDVIWTYRLYSYISSILIVPVVTYVYEANSSSLMHTSELQAKRLFDSLIIVSDFVYKNPPIVDGKTIHYSAHRLFVTRWLMMAIDVKENHHFDSDQFSKLYSVRSVLFWDAVKHMRLFLILLLLLLFPPLRTLMSLHWFRSKFYLLEQFVYKMSK